MGARFWLVLTLSAAAACGDDDIRRAQPIAMVSGQICDESTKLMVPEANVVLIEQDSKGVILSQQEGQTDQEGRFEFKRVASGTHVLRADKGTFVFQTSVTVRSNRDTLLPPPDCALPTGNVNGRICDAKEGAWVGGADIYVAGPSGEAIRAPAPSGTDGSFTLSGVPSGWRDVIADKNGFKYAVPVLVRAGETVDLGVSDCVKDGLSNIEGQICANAPGFWLANATVTTSGPSGEVTVKTDLDGKFTLRSLPPGAYTVKVTKGAFSVEFDAVTEPSKTTRLPAPLCTSSDLPVAVVSGQYDAVQKVMKRLQFSQVTVWQGHDGHDDIADLPADRTGSWSTQLLDGASPEIFNYKIAMFNSGLEEDDLGAFGSEQYQRRLQTLRRFVAEGGVVFVSDTAYDLIASSFGSPIAFVGDGGQNAAEKGINQSLEASVLDIGLAGALGGSPWPVSLETPQWAVISSIGPAVKTYVSGSPLISQPGGPMAVPNTPLLLSFPVSKGKVVFSAFETDRQPAPQMDKLMDFLIFEE